MVHPQWEQNAVCDETFGSAKVRTPASYRISTSQSAWSTLDWKWMPHRWAPWGSAVKTPGPRLARPPGFEYVGHCVGEPVFVPITGEGGVESGRNVLDCPGVVAGQNDSGDRLPESARQLKAPTVQDAPGVRLTNSGAKGEGPPRNTASPLSINSILTDY